MGYASARGEVAEWSRSKGADDRAGQDILGGLSISCGMDVGGLK